MIGRRLDDLTARRLLHGAVAAEDAPQGWAGTAALLHAAAARPPAREPAPELLGALVAAIGSDPQPTSRRKPVLTKLLSAKVAATAAVLVLGSGVAAAATDNLPSAAQEGVARAARHVGLDLPGDHDADSADDSAGDNAGDNGTGDSTSDADDDSDAAHPDNHGGDVSTVARTPAADGENHGAAVCAVASEGRCKPEDRPTTSTTTPDDDDNDGDDAEGRGAGSDNRGPGSDNSGRGRSGDHRGGDHRGGDADAS